MVTISKRGAVYYAQYREGGKQFRVSLKTGNRKLAQEHRLMLEVELGRRRLGLAPEAAPAPEPDPAPTPEAEPVVGLADIRAGYEAYSVAHKRPKTILNDKSRLAAFFETVPRLEFGQIRTSHVEGYLTQLAVAGRSPATLLRNREILHAFWRWAVRQGFAAVNVVSPIPRPRLPERDPVFLGLGQVDELLAAVAGSVVEGPVATAVFAGLRREELCWLTDSDLVLTDRPVIRVRAKKVGAESWQPKTKRDRRVPVSPRLAAVLRTVTDGAGKHGQPWLFPSPGGRRWDPDNLSRSIRAVLKRAGLSWNLLELRHTFGSQLAQKGVSLLKIAKLMGNSPAVAAKHYINLVPEDMADDVTF